MMAYDRPSPKFLSFLAKHYCLTQSVPQVQYALFFHTISVCEHPVLCYCTDTFDFSLRYCFSSEDPNDVVIWFWLLIAPLTVIFRHCFHPHLARMCIFYYIYQSLGVFVSHKNNLKKITVTLKYILEIHCKEGDKNGNWSEKMNKKTAHKVFHYTSYMFMFSK